MIDCVSPIPIFGTRDNEDQHDPEVWCVAKLVRLLNGLPPPVDKYRGSEFRLAAMLADVNAGYIKIGSLRAEIQRLNLPEAISSLILSLLVADDQIRPIADEVLGHGFSGDF